MHRRLADKRSRDLFLILCLAGFILLFGQCRQEMPVTASILVDGDTARVPVNRDLYGLSLEEEFHAVDGGIYAEMICNRSFEDAVLPPNCRFDAARKVLVTPNGWTLPFFGEDTVIAWHKLSSGTHLALDRTELINDKNRFSLYVGVYETALAGRGGAVAEGYGGIALKEGARYALSFFLKSAYASGRTVSVALEDSTGKAVSDVFRVSPSTQWTRYGHTFTALASTDKASLVFSTDSTHMFWMDVVSLFPEETWKGRKNGLRNDLAGKLAALSPRFLRFPGGDFAEGYTAGSYPEWSESLGDISTRKHFWNVFAYGSTNGMGFHEYLQLAEDLGAEPVYVVNAGITSQDRRPRYEDISKMDEFVRKTLDALEYANAPADSFLGSLRARNGHPEPFGLKYIQIGNRNAGPEYARRFEFFRKVLAQRYPGVTVIASEYQPAYRADWVDYPYRTGEKFLLSHADFYDPKGIVRSRPPVTVYAFSASQPGANATLGRAVAEACFMIGAERNPDQVKHLGYSPLLANTMLTDGQPAALCFDNRRVLATPSYHLLDLFMNNRGDEVVKTTVHSFDKPYVTFGSAGVYLFDNAYEITRVALDGSYDYPAHVRSGEWKTLPDGELVPASNKWNYILLGDSSAYNYTFSARVRRTKGSGQIRFSVRDDGRDNASGNRINLTMSPGRSELSCFSGRTEEVLDAKDLNAFAMNTWYDIRITAEDEFVRCYVNDSLVHEVEMKPLPSLVSVATMDTVSHTLLLKVVNTTNRQEKTQIDLKGMSVKLEAEVTELAGEPDRYNTYEKPDVVALRTRKVDVKGSSSFTYEFPPNSVSLMRFRMEK